MAIYARMYTLLLLPYMAMYTRIHAPLLLPCDQCVPLYMAYVCAHACPIAAPMWPIYARMHPPLSGTKIRTIRKAVKKRQALYLIWTSVVIAAIGYICGQE